MIDGELNPESRYLSKVSIHATLTFNSLHIFFVDENLESLLYFSNIHSEATRPGVSHE